LPIVVILCGIIDVPTDFAFQTVLITEFVVITAIGTGKEGITHR
jgi:hypothetical protein